MRVRVMVLGVWGMSWYEPLGALTRFGVYEYDGSYNR